RMAERVLAAVVPVLGCGSTASNSDTRPLAGGDLAGAPDLASYAASPEVRAGMEGVPPQTLSRLLEAYGSDALEVVHCAGEPEALAPLAPGVPLSVAEVRHAARREMVCTVTDVLERRSRLALFATEEARAAAPAVARILADELHWTDARRDAEIARFEHQADARLGWRRRGQESD
ncbi:MAG: glycerol-3-phosphate dehydrogenase C-terminal domain-containing protein, partial [Candidatus Binatia bacterium]